jgi:hypothetical protein
VLGSFKILVLIHDGESKSYLARHPSFDRTIMLHVLPKPESPEYGVLAGYLERLTPNGRKMLLDRGADEGAEYVVTERILDFHSLPAWLEKVATQAPLSAPSTAPPPPVPAAPPGEFTRLFQAAPAEPGPTPTGSVASPPPTPPGEFTRLFSSSATPAAQPPAPSQPVASQPKKPGSFTKQFLALSDTHPPSAPQPAAATPSKPGEFTAFFKAPLPPAPDPPLAAAPVPKATADPGSAKPAFPQAGEFTRMFGEPLPGAAPPQPPAAPAKPQPQLSYTAMFEAPPSPTPAAPPLPPRAVSAPTIPTPTPPTVNAAPSNKVLILIFVVLLVAALLLVGYFALKR